MWWLVLELVNVRIALAQQKQSGQEVVNISSKNGIRQFFGELPRVRQFFGKVSRLRHFLEICREQLRFRNFFAARSAYFGELIDDCFIFGKIVVKSFVNFSVC